MRVLHLDIFAALAGLVLLCGCANPDRVLFVTQTDIGVGYDATAASAHVGYDRTVVYMGPDYPEHGGLPPVAASLQSDLAFVAPAVKQFYATGDAALIATGRINKPTPSDTDDAAKKCSLNKGCKWDTDQDRRFSVVGTNTHVGFIVKTKDTALAAVDFGYGRQEASMLPLRSSHGEDKYPSVLAAISVDTNSNNGKLGEGGAGLKLAEFFATGAAADMLASTKGVQDAFSVQAQAAAKQQTVSLAKSTGLSDAETTKLVEVGATYQHDSTNKTDTVVQKILGDAPGADRALTDTDRKALETAAQKLTGTNDDTTTLRGQAMLLIKCKTVKDVRNQLNSFTDVRDALAKS